MLDALWERLGIGPAMRELLKGRRLDPGAERVLFALVANRAFAPSSKLAAARWASEDVLIAGLQATTDDACYRAMDWLLQIREALEKRVFDRACEVLGLEVDLLFFDTTSTYFVTEEADAPVARDERGNPVPDGVESAADTREAGFRTWGKSKDHRDDLPQVVIGMAVTRDGIPLRVWCWPGNTSDSALIRQVKDDLLDIRRVHGGDGADPGDPPRLSDPARRQHLAGLVRLGGRDRRADHDQEVAGHGCRDPH